MTTIMNEGRRNYLVAKRAALAIRRYADERRTAGIFRDNANLEFYGERAKEHYFTIQRTFEGLSVEQREEIEDLIYDAVHTEAITVSNMLDQMGRKLRRQIA